MPVFTISFCAVLAIVYILDSLILIPRGETVTAKEKLLTGLHRRKGSEDQNGSVFVINRGNRMGQHGCASS